MDAKRNTLSRLISVPAVSSLAGIGAMVLGFLVLQDARQLPGGWEDYTEGRRDLWFRVVSVLVMPLAFHMVTRFALARTWWRVLAHGLLTACAGPYVGMIAYVLVLGILRERSNDLVIASFGVWMGYGLPMLFLCWRKRTVLERLPRWLLWVWLGVSAVVVGPAVFAVAMRLTGWVHGGDFVEALGFDTWRIGAVLAWCNALFAVATSGILGAPKPVPVSE